MKNGVFIYSSSVFLGFRLKINMILSWLTVGNGGSFLVLSEEMRSNIHVCREGRSGEDQNIPQVDGPKEALCWQHLDHQTHSTVLTGKYLIPSLLTCCSPREGENQSKPVLEQITMNLNNMLRLWFRKKSKQKKGTLLQKKSFMHVEIEIMSICKALWSQRPFVIGTISHRYWFISEIHVANERKVSYTFSLLNW